MSEIYCLLLVLIGSFFLLNVILAVIMDAFDEVAAQEEELKERLAADLKQLKIDYGFDVTDNEEEPSVVKSRNVTAGELNNSN